MAEKEAGACLFLALFIEDDDEVKTRGSTRKWIKRREEEGNYANLVQELRVEDAKTYKKMMRMDYDCFKGILGYLEPYITATEYFCGLKVLKAPFVGKHFTSIEAKLR